MSKPVLNLVSTEDKVILENFRRIDKEWGKEPILRGQWKFVEITFQGAVANFKFKHYLKFVPKDVIQTSLRGSGLVVWNYDLFDRDNLNITTTDACTVRAFIGRYEEGGV